MSRGFWAGVSAALERGDPVFVVLVAAHSRGSPGTTGARMLVRADGSQLGTIGGGMMERNLLAEARLALADPWRRPRLVPLRHQRRDPAVVGTGESGLICAGRQTNIELVLLPARDGPVVTRLAVLERDGDRGRFTIDRHGLRCDAAEPDPDTPACRLEHDAAWRYTEQLLNPNRIAIVGGGHCSRALSHTMASVGYHVTVFDRRADVATFRDNDDADRRVVVRDYADAGAAIPYPGITDVVVMTSDFPSDVRALLGCIGRDFRFLGVMGSGAKIHAIGSALAEAGVDAAERRRIEGPIGLPMKSDTPEEIAISVTAQLLQRARERLQPAPAAERRTHTVV